jgi:hypothetical protein
VSLFGTYGRAEIELKLALATGRWLVNPNGTGKLYQKPPQVSGNTPSIPDRVGWRYAAVRVHPAAGYIA